MSAPTDPRDYDYSHPERECDIVMKGGITSGVVYPHAVCELARTYRLVNVGGTSAGAIAAAVAGAAEAGRAHDGFRKLADLPDWIAGEGHLLELFQPQPRTRRLFSVLVASLSKENKLERIQAALLAAYWPWVLVAVAPGALVIGLAIWLADGAGLALALVGGVFMAVVGLVAGLAVGALRDVLRIPANDFGLCTGNGGPDPPALTPWLADRIDELAGRATDGPPLTFDELEQAGVRLRLMTTNLTQRRPLRLPWADTEKFFFDPAELRQFFPERVVRHLETHPPPAPDEPQKAKRWQWLCTQLEPLRPLPAPGDLPVVFGARLSLSFPLLLSALPLYAVDWSRKANQEASAALSTSASGPQVHADVCWFSDGGISSNFPIHFFDSPVPARPTFGINLRGFHPDYPRSANEEENVYLPEASGAGRLEAWYPYPATGFKRLAGFVESIARTMQNRVDEAQMRVPGYRDRIVHVGTAPDEGGMNLNMPSNVILALTTRGRLAAVKLIDRFAKPPQPGKLSWDSHRWTRYRSSIAAIAELLGQVRDGFTHSVPAGDRSYADLLQGATIPPPSAYRLTAGQQVLAKRLTDDLIAASAPVAPAPTPGVPPKRPLDDDAPEPRPEARIVPRT